MMYRAAACELSVRIVAAAHVRLIVVYINAPV
jgi:hypothetical protein